MGIVDVFSLALLLQGFSWKSFSYSSKNLYGYFVGIPPKHFQGFFQRHFQEHLQRLHHEIFQDFLSYKFIVFIHVFETKNTQGLFSELF